MVKRVNCFFKYFKKVNVRKLGKRILWFGVYIFEVIDFKFNKILNWVVVKDFCRKGEIVYFK